MAYKGFGQSPFNSFTYPIQPPDLFLFKQRSLIYTNLSLTPSPSSLLLILYNRPTYSSSIIIACFLTAFGRVTYPVQTSVLPLFKSFLIPIQASVLLPFRSLLTPYQRRPYIYFLFKHVTYLQYSPPTYCIQPSDLPPLWNLYLLLYKPWSYLYTIIRLTLFKMLSYCIQTPYLLCLSTIQSHTYLRTNPVAVLEVRYSGHHFSRLMRAGSLHSHPEHPAYLKREDWKAALNRTARAQ